MSLIPIGIETQPILLLLFIVIAWAIDKNTTSQVTLAQFSSIVFSIILILFTITSFFTFGISALLGGAKYLIGPLIFIVGYHSFPQIRLKVLCVVLILFLLYIILSFTIGEGLIRQILILPSRHMLVDRLAIFTPEPSYFSNTFVLFISLTYYLRRKLMFEPKPRKIYLLILNVSPIILVFCGLLTGSALVYLFILIYFACLAYAKFERSFIKLVFYVFIIFSIIIFIILNGPPTRMQHIFNVIIDILYGVPLEGVLYGSETSGSTRILLSYIAFSIPFDTSIFGTGIGSFPQTWPDIAHSLGLPIHKHELLKRLAPFYAPTYLSNVTAEIGIGALFMLPIFLMGNYKKDNESSIETFILSFAKVCLIFFFLFQSQITNPIPWLMLILIKKGSWKFKGMNKI